MWTDACGSAWLADPGTDQRRLRDMEEIPMKLTLTSNKVNTQQVRTQKPARVALLLPKMGARIQIKGGEMRLTLNLKLNQRVILIYTSRQKER